MIVLAIIMILAGLFLPTMSKVRATARGTNRLASVQHTTALILVYASDYKDTFPILNPGGNPLEETRYFYKLLINSGAITDKHQIDPIGWAQMRKRGYNEIALAYSMCLVYDPEYMQPGLTLPVDERKSRAVRSSEVIYPTQKGALHAITTFDEERDGLWCCVPGAPKGPVGFLDGSAGNYFALELIPDSTLYTENEIGFPVFTTWGGVKGRDRQP